MEKILEEIREMSLERKIALHNEWCDANNYVERVYNMTDFDDLQPNIFADMSPTDIINRVQEDFESFDSNDYYFYFEESDETYCSFNSEITFEDKIFSPEDIANYIISSNNSLGFDEIKELLSEEDEDE